jgi:type IV pilus assembly protein PilB
MIWGEKAVLRLLDSSKLDTLRIENLGFEPDAEKAFRDAIGSSYGLVVVTGPTGSGKSTTLYTALKETLNPEEHVVTVEDPVEYQLAGVTQIMVNVKQGLTFPVALRALLRQDPDTILVGEIRDLETADIAVKAALTGHLVLSTLHTNDAAGSVDRLADMGVDRFMISSSVVMASAQRLLRRLCTGCRRPIEKLPPEDYLLKVGFKEDEIHDLVLYDPVGCQNCLNGYKGRFAILEALPVDSSVRRMIVKGESSVKIKYAAMERGMTTLRRCAILNAMRGSTSLQEVLNMTMGEEVES